MSRYTVQKTGYGFWPNCVRAGCGQRELFIGHRKQCERVAAELEKAFLDGEFKASTDVARLHEELAKANGACADMALELNDLINTVNQQDALISQLQNELHDQRLLNDRLMDPIIRAKMLEPPPPIIMHIKPDAQ